MSTRDFFVMLIMEGRETPTHCCWVESYLQRKYKVYTTHLADPDHGECNNTGELIHKAKIPGEQDLVFCQGVATSQAQV